MTSPNEGITRSNRTSGLLPVLLFWAGYVAITLAVGFATALLIRSEVWQLTAWGFISSAGLIVLTRFFIKKDAPGGKDPGLAVSRAAWGNLSLGLLIGVVSFGVHVLIVSLFAGPVRFEVVPGVGAMVVIIFFARFLATSCMEEIGFRGYALQRLEEGMGTWWAVIVTAVVFGLSHLLYGWSLQTILLGVIPGGLLWGMSAVATRGIAMPIGLHAAWNFAGWSAGNRSEAGLLSMVIDDDALARTQMVGTISYLVIFVSLTMVFWIVHRRRSRGA
ncbi:CPBP family intramembrane metalloprotease [Marinihelvus fidelis]|uniref:CPBP family intramembrane metalloprotease n=1 Tax=Marinihelvus fidelis TaxID=2613842 RepID=A0A5N0TDI8_9GAMM|nr:type II CAAX endopeptidase family protein [Marinihelvus fidelis]KAA9132534.1 CPBP family intramembrane metalloprotease [Marinihelvus fidelis]